MPSNILCSLGKQAPYFRSRCTSFFPSFVHLDPQKKKIEMPSNIVCFFGRTSPYFWSGCTEQFFSFDSFRSSERTKKKNRRVNSILCFGITIPFFWNELHTIFPFDFGALLVGRGSPLISASPVFFVAHSLWGSHCDPRFFSRPPFFLRPRFFFQIIWTFNFYIVNVFANSPPSDLYSGGVGLRFVAHSGQSCFPHHCAKFCLVPPNHLIKNPFLSNHFSCFYIGQFELPAHPGILLLEKKIKRGHENSRTKERLKEKKKHSQRETTKECVREQKLNFDIRW